MNFGRTIWAICMSAAVALAAPAGARAAVTVSYVSPAQTCTTKDAQKPNPNAQPNANPNWWMGTPQNQVATRLPSGRDPNDYPTLQTFPTVYSQPVDTNKNGPKPLSISTCASPP